MCLPWNSIFGSWLGWYTFYVGIDKTFTFFIWNMFQISPEEYQICFSQLPYIHCICLLISADQSLLVLLTVSVLFLCILRRIFAVATL